MRISERIQFWRKLAEETAPNISLSSIPTFKPNLFAVKPEFVRDLQTIVNILNKYLFTLSDGKLDFSATWKSPSMGPSQFSGGLKNVFSLAKWIYSVISANEPAYTIDGLRKIIKDLNTTISNMDFPEPKASSFKSEIISVNQLLSNKLG
jgi:hypothetical protein